MGGRAGGRVGVGDLDETGQGLRFAHSRRAERVKRKLQEPSTNTPVKLIKALITPEGVGKKEGRELASFLVEEKDALPFVRAHGGPMGFLSAQVSPIAPRLPLSLPHPLGLRPPTPLKPMSPHCHRRHPSPRPLAHRMGASPSNGHSR